MARMHHHTTPMAQRRSRRRGLRRAYGHGPATGGVGSPRLAQVARDGRDRLLRRSRGGGTTTNTIRPPRPAKAARSCALPMTVVTTAPTRAVLATSSQTTPSTVPPRTRPGTPCRQTRRGPTNAGVTRPGVAQQATRATGHPADRPTTGHRPPARARDESRPGRTAATPCRADPPRTPPGQPGMGA